MSLVINFSFMITTNLSRISGAGRSPWSPSCSPTSPSPTLRQGTGNPSKIQILVQKSFDSSRIPGSGSLALIAAGHRSAQRHLSLNIAYNDQHTPPGTFPPPVFLSSQSSTKSSPQWATFLNMDSVAKILMFNQTADYSLRLVILWHLQVLSICSVNFLLQYLQSHQEVFFWGIALSLLSLQVNVSCHKTFNPSFTMIYQTSIDCSK